MENFEVVCLGLESPADAAFQESMRPELQQRLLAMDIAEWEMMAQTWPNRPLDWVMQLCDTLSPSKHGLAATKMLMDIAEHGPTSCLILIIPKLLAQTALNVTDRSLLLRRLEQLPVPAGQHAAQQLAELQARLMDTTERPSLPEACEYSVDHQAALAASARAGCYYCQTIFETETISEYIDGGKTALCPHCGTDAVLPSASGYDLSPAGLQALNEFWFH